MPEQEQEQEQEQEGAPQTITRTPDYDPADPEHRRQYLAAGSPDLSILDADGLPWRPTIIADLQEDGSYLDRPAPPAPSPVQATAAMLGAREQAAAATITQLKAAVAVALIAGGMSQPDTMAAGSQLVLDHAAKIQAYILAGGNPVAGQALIDEVVANPPLWWGPAILSIFESELLGG